MTLPTIHVNGTPASRLLEDTMRASDNLCQAMQALEDAAPNARDYYPQGPDAFRRAVHEHQARLARLHAVCRELEEISEYLAQFA